MAGASARTVQWVLAWSSRSTSLKTQKPAPYPDPGFCLLFALSFICRAPPQGNLGGKRQLLDQHRDALPGQFGLELLGFVAVVEAAGYHPVHFFAFHDLLLQNHRQALLE